jgi:methyltransferase
MVTSAWVYLGVVAVVALERVAELVVSRRNLAWSLARGGVEVGFGHFPVMVVLHTGFLVACALEVVVLDRVFVPWIGVSMGIVAVLAQGLRWWCITTLGPQWNTRVVVVPGLPRVTGGPYRWLSHPNYVAVVAEGVALPMIHGAVGTAVLFSALNGILLWWRIRVEESALARLEAT